MNGEERDAAIVGGAVVEAIDVRGLAPLVALNNAHAVELSWLDDDKMAVLVRRSFRARAAGGGAGFLLAFDQDADYGSPNFLWFKERHERFVYVDRVVVDPAARGRGLARALYEDLFAAAIAAEHTLVTCEVNMVPSNPASDAFHARLGFAEVGRAVLPGSGKRVRYLARPLP